MRLEGSFSPGTYSVPRLLPHPPATNQGVFSLIQSILSTLTAVGEICGSILQVGNAAMRVLVTFPPRRVP